MEVSRAVLNTLKKNGYIQIIEEKIQRNPFKNKKIKPDTKKILNSQQEICFKKISESIENNMFSNNLIYGITGSRKNRNLFTINRKSN